VRRLRVLVLMHPDFVPPDSADGYTAGEINEWKTEFDVVSTLRAAGHDVRPLGVQEEIKPVRDEIESFKPHVVFTLLEEFHNESVYDQHIASYLELMKIPYTGCNPRGLILARGRICPRRWCIIAGSRCRPLPCFRCAARSNGRRALRCR
jgi:D-alanine-D-alanine ligase